MPFAAAETELHAEYRAKRKRGERVSGQWLRISMKRLVREHYGDDAADGFKASKLWLRHFARRFGISLRRKSNAKAEPVEVRLPKIKRWHARLRRRLKRGDRIDPVYGLPHGRGDGRVARAARQPGALDQRKAPRRAASRRGRSASS